MSRNNRIQQPYGYREQNNLTTEPAMICNAITGGSTSSKEIIEKINYILYNGFFGVSYDKGLDSYAFTNSLGNLIGAAKLEDIVVNQLIQEVGYNQDEKKIFIKLENNETIEIPLDALVNQVNGLVEDEAILRKEEDDKIWDAISGSSSGDTNLRELIEQEISARTDEDQKIWDAIGEMSESGSSLIDLIKQEESARTDEDQKIWDTIGEMSGDTNLRELIEQEISARTDADNAIRHDLGEEIVARTQGDTALFRAINEEANARSQGDENLEGLIGTEKAEREAKDTEILAALSAETEERESGDTALGKRIDDEKAARLYWDNQLSGAIITEKAEREAKDTEILAALSAETNARESGDTALKEEIQLERIERARVDGILEGLIDAEKDERMDTDEILSGSIINERAERVTSDNQLSSAITTEKAEREAKDAEILAALSAETSARESGDTAIESKINDNKVTVTKVETSLPTNVREAYELKNTLGEVLGARINIYKDSSLKDVELTDHDDSGHTGQFLMLTYILEDGTEKVEYLDVSQFLVEAEFKDGLVVNNAGEVRVKVDTASEPYLTVSQNGVKISGIDEIAQNLTNEITYRKNADTILETLITTESTARQSADNELNNAITAETSAREAADSELNTKLSNEKAERKADDAALSTQIGAETTNRANADQVLNSLIEQVSSGLSTEVSNRTNADASLQEQINGLKSADIEIRSSIATVENNLMAETSNRSQADADLQLQINKKANSVDVYYKAEADSIFATKAEIPTDFYSKAEVDGKDTAIKQMITAETAAREAEDVRLNNAITAETQARESADQNLQSQINSLQTELDNKVVEVKAKDTSVTVDNANATKPEIKVNISTEEDQIVKLNADGIYAKSKLSYDEEHNILIYANTTGTTAIALKTKSEIDRIYYDKPNERIVIEYTVNGTRKEDVYVPVHDLIEEWRTEDGNLGAIALSKDISIPEVDVLKARLILNTTHGDNAAIIDDNALYVSKNAIVSGVTEEINALKARVATLEAALQLAAQEHTTQSQRIAQVEQKNDSQDESIADLINYIN